MYHTEDNGSNRVSTAQDAVKKMDRRNEALVSNPSFREDLSPEADE
jgi:hypothetical protein